MTTEKGLALTEGILAGRTRVLEAIPPCPAHGNACVPHALAWIEKAKEAMSKARPCWTDPYIPEEDQ